MTTIRTRFFASLLAAGLFALPAAAATPPAADAQTGTAAFYSHVFEGRRTADHGHYHGHRMTAASATLPIGSRARVTNLKNDRSVVVRITDLYHSSDRIIDVSHAAAKKLGFVKAGTAQVRVEPL